MLSLRPSFTPYPITGLYIILVLLNSHFINGNRGWTRNETDASGDLKRNRRVASAQNHFKTNIAYCLFVLSAKRFSRNRISSKYLNHASAYSLHCRHGQQEQIARMRGKSDECSSSTANQCNNSGRFRGHPA